MSLGMNMMVQSLVTALSIKPDELQKTLSAVVETINNADARLTRIEQNQAAIMAWLDPGAPAPIPLPAPGAADEGSHSAPLKD